MVGFIFGIIFLIAGIIAAVCLAQYKRIEKTEEYVLDEEGNRVRSSYGGYRTTTKETVTKPLAKFSVVSVVAGVFLAILLTFFGCIASIDTGHVGIVKTFGKVEDYTFDSGFHLKAPWNSVTQMDNRVQKTTVELSCFSSDIQEVTISYTVNYQISKTNAQNLYRDVGTNYLETVVNPTIQETVKTVVARYKAEGNEAEGTKGLVKDRAEVAAEIEALLKVNLDRYHIDVSSTAIENMDFTDSFTNAVEAKAVAAQQKLQAEIEQQRLTMEAQKAAERAQIEANAQKEVNRINAEAAAEVAEIQAKADAEVAKISANAAEYQGQKEAAIALQRLAAVNGWTVVTNIEYIQVTNKVLNEETEDPDDYIDKITYEKQVTYTFEKADGSAVTPDELKIGTEKLIEYYYTQTWNGELPDTYVGMDGLFEILSSATTDKAAPSEGAGSNP
jgi:regulator of protease activity HflC (stomatin/prohibitin superfamily)